MFPAPLAAAPVPDSPCAGICRMDPSGFCTGCRRTLEEIEAWPFLAVPARVAILADLPARAPVSTGDFPLEAP